MAAGVVLVRYDEIPAAARLELRRRYLDEIRHPVLTSSAGWYPGHPFPYISTLSLSIAVGLRDPETGAARFARVEVPPVLPRLLELPRDAAAPPGHHRFVLLDQVIEANLDLRLGREMNTAASRNYDLEIEEDEADDLLLAIEEEVRLCRFWERRSGSRWNATCRPRRGHCCCRGRVSHPTTCTRSGMLDATALMQLLDLDRPDMKTRCGSRRANARSMAQRSA